MSLNRDYTLNPGNALAILIGIEHYEDFARVDPAPSNVRALAELLGDEQVLGLPPDRIKTIVGGRSADIKESLFDIFEKLQGQGLETLIFYFVGHGYRRPNGEYYLAAEDSKKRLLRLDGSTGIAFNTIKQIILQSGIPQRLIFLDSCYSGSTTLSDEGGIGDLRLKGTYTIASSDSREVSYFDTEHSHTLFTGELIHILRTGLEDVGERIRLDELYSALKLAVRSRNPKMSPQQLGSQEITGGNYLFCKNRQFNAMAAQRTEITAAIGRGDEHLKTKELQQAEYQYLRARHLAEEHGLLPDFREEIQNRMEKLRYAEELHRQWENGPDPEVEEEEEQTPDQPRPVIRLPFFRRRKNQRIAGLLLAVGMVAAFAFWMAGTRPHEPDQNVLVHQDAPGRKLSGPEIIAQMEKNMVAIPGGSFTRGCTFEQVDDCYDNEKHISTVRIPTFLLNRYEVTQQEWRAVMGSAPPDLTFKGCDRCPVEKVSWKEVQEFIRKLNEQTGRHYRLPSESEWEYAARGGQSSKEFKYAGSGELERVGWYAENSEGKTQPVGLLAPNELGLYDMSGNVYEWCQDHFHASYEGAPTDGSAWEDPDSLRRVLRGGSWDHPARRCRVSTRSFWHPEKRYKDVGLRLAGGE